MSSQAPMISTPLKQTQEIDWNAPLKHYIRTTYGDNPERYSEECSTLNRLRQDMRGASKDTAAGRDLLYRYYGQLELLDLRFPVDENHIKILFTWFDAFTQKPTSQHSLAFEKASIIFNIAAVLSCYAAVQNRHEETGLKTAYHSFQASAGMFTYINENFLHAPSVDLNHQTVRTLIGVMLAQAQEVFLEKQVNDGKKASLLAKLAMQASFLYSQAMEGVQENVNGAVFERVWLQIVQIKQAYLASVAQYFQAISDNESGSYGVAIARLQTAAAQAKDAKRNTDFFPNSSPANSNIGSDAGSILVELVKKHAACVQEKLTEFNKDNDFIYHVAVPSEASLSLVTKLPAAKAISVSELYQGQDINRIIGPDIFQKIVPMSVTESASLYDEEKAKLVRAEAERVETADSEMAASLDYLKLPQSLNVLKGGISHDIAVDEEFRRWCDDLAGHAPFDQTLEETITEKSRISSLLDQSTRQLDMEESVCEKMRSKYGADWTQQPSSRLSMTLRSDIRNYRAAIEEASLSDTQLQNTLNQFTTDFEELKHAGETGEADVLYQKAILKASEARGSTIVGVTSAEQEINLLDEQFDEGSASVADQIEKVEELLRKLNLIKKERAQVLKDLKEKVHNDDISQVLILNKRAITTQDNQLFKNELEKFKPHQTRILQANHKQASVLKDLTRIYGQLLQDKRVRNEQTKYEAFSRQKNSVMTRYRRAWQAFNDLERGTERARVFYSDMKGTVESLMQNVESFVNNRKAEGGELLTQIEKGSKPHGTIAGQTRPSADREQEKLRELMDRMSVSGPRMPSSSLGQQTGPSPNPSNSHQVYGASAVPPSAGFAPKPPPLTSTSNSSSTTNQYTAPAGISRYNPAQRETGSYAHSQFTQGVSRPGASPTHPNTQIPADYHPPPPPPRPAGQNNQSGTRLSPGGISGDPWAGLNSWR